MDFLVKKGTKAAAFTRVSFLKEQVILSGVTEAILPYNEIDLKIIIHLETSARSESNQQHGVNAIIYTPHVSQLTFLFTPSIPPIPVDVLGNGKEIFSLLDEKHPFKSFSYEFQNSQADTVRKYFAQELTRRLEDHLKYGIHTEELVRVIRRGQVEEVRYSLLQKTPKKLAETLFVLFFLVILLVPIGFLYYLFKHWNNDVICWSFAAGSCIFLLIGIISLRKIFNRYLIQKKLEAAKKGNTEN